MAQTQKPVAFEAASLKASKDITWHDRTDIGLVTQRGATLRELVALAYGTKEDRVTGGPKWTDSDRFDVDAKAGGPAKDEELERMLQTFLAERFQLVVHTQSKQVSGYALVVVKGGIRAKPSEGSDQPRSQSHNGSLTATAIKMDGFADWLSRRVAVPVADATGLTGPYSFSMVWDYTQDRSLSSSMADAVPTATDPKGQTLFVALQEQLGLRLEPRNVPVDVIVVDRAEKPTFN
jgi:uncharacterized protein (TIGR03435 family)